MGKIHESLLEPKTKLIGALQSYEAIWENSLELAGGAH